MKYSGPIGIFAGIILIGATFLPWAYIPSINSELTGLSTPNTRFGKPGLLHIIFTALSIGCFLVPAVWAKRLNVFLGAFNFAWSIRNYILLNQCEMGECPETKPGIYIALLASAVIFLMTLMPKTPLSVNHSTKRRDS
jgi:hypothetical protein